MSLPHPAESGHTKKYLKGSKKPPRVFFADLSGGEEVPPVDTESSGHGQFRLDRHETKLSFTYKLHGAPGSGLTGASGSHLHCAPKGVNGALFALMAGATPGAVDGSTVLSGGFDGDAQASATLTAGNIIPTNTCENSIGYKIETIADVAKALRNGDVYVNIHSVANPSGELRGQVYQANQKGGTYDEGAN